MKNKQAQCTFLEKNPLMPNSPPPPGPRAAPTSARRQLTWCRYPMHEFTLRFRPRTPPPRPGFLPPPAAPAGLLSLCVCGGGALLSANASSEAKGAGAGLAAGRRICQTGLDRPTGTPPPARPGLAAHRRGGPASPRELLREHGALLTFRAGGRGFDVPDPPPAERLREKGQMLMFSSEPPPACAACFRPLAPSLRFSLSFSLSFSSAGFLEKISVQRLDPPVETAAGGAGEVMEAVGGATVARSDASAGSASGSGSGAGGTLWLVPLLLPAWDDAGFGGRTGSGRRTPPEKSSSAQDGEAAGSGWSGQNSNSGEEDALLLLTSAASMAAGKGAGHEHSQPQAQLWLLFGFGGGGGRGRCGGGEQRGFEIGRAHV